MRDGFQSGPALAEALRGAARAVLPAGAFLRRDRGDGLFVTDAPRLDGRCEEALRAAGFEVEEIGGLLRISPAACWLTSLMDAWPAPPDFLCGTLKRFRGAPERESLALFARGAKLLLGEPDDHSFDRQLRQRAAVCLRAGGGGGLYGCGILRYFINNG